VGLCGLVLKLLKGFHDLIPNWGVAIILLTLLVRTVTFPLTIAQTKQGVRMTQHAPAIQKIREKNKGNPQKANLEIMEYYKKQGINPLASVMGCFPVLLQMPIFIALFNVLGRAVELKDAPFVGWITDLSRPDVVWSGLTVPYIFPLGLTVLPFFMAGTMWMQMKLSIKDPNQKMLVWMMPAMMFVFSCSFPSGLVLYWTISNIFTIGQTYFYTNRLTRDATATGTKPPSAGKPVPRKPAKT
jgi:YidC/Oxa1 family membrane protein insertase